MRAVIFIGLSMIAMSIDLSIIKGQSGFFAAIAIVSLLMDFAELYIKASKTK